MSKGIYTGEEVPNEEGVDYDHGGYCSLCHRKFDLEGIHSYDNVQVLLSNQSLMTCSICKKCKEDFKPSDSARLMESSVRGWAHDDSAKVAESILRQSSLEIIIRSDAPWTAKAMQSITKPDKKKMGPIVKAVMDKVKEGKEKS